ncbi:MAG: hypothetical protein ACSHYB_08125 [Roseibacillus sp.]
MVSQLGDNIIDFFESSSRGANQGKNDNGIEIEYIALSLEPVGEDRNIINLSVNNNYTLWGLDAAADRTLPRESFSLFSGFPASSPPGSLGSSNRRRIVVVDATDGSNLVTRHNDVPLSSGSLGTTNINLIRAAINVAEPAPAGTDYAAWVSENLSTSSEVAFADDADDDGWANGIEFAAGTHPDLASSTPLLDFQAVTNGYQYSYQQATDRVGITHQLLTGDLINLLPFTPLEENRTTEPMGDGLEKVTILLPSDFGPYIQQQITENP